jgi:fatty-acyl-CoA synthase
MPAATIRDLIAAAAAERPDALGAAFPGERASFAQLAERSAVEGRRLRAPGLDAGDRVGILVPANLRHLDVLLGAMTAGLVPVPLNPRFKTRELGYIVGHSQMRVLIVAPELTALATESAGDGCDIVEIDAPAPARDAPPPVPPESEHDAIILYTSGTTADPKGVVHTHASLVAEGRNIEERLGLRPGDRFWSPLPLFHTGGIVTMLGALAARAAFVHVGTFEPGAALDQLERERATHAFPAFDTVWMPVLDHPRFPDADLGALRIVINVGLPERLRMMQERLPSATQISSFGSTESCGFMCMGLATDSLELRTTTSGTVMTGMEVRAVDPTTGEDVAPGVPGEALYRGVTRFKEYFRDPEATRAAIDADGWFHSGDLITLDAEGRLSFVGRLKDMLKVGGENVAPAEIEDVLLQHSAVRLVQVVGAPDARYAEVPAAFVELRPGAGATEDELIDFCLGRIATFKVPRYVRFVQEWPMSGTKVRKFVLRERIAEELRAARITEAPRLSARNRAGAAG